MATIEIKDQALVITIEGLDKIMALRSSITVPLAHVTGVTARPDISKLMYMPVEAQFRGVRNPGSILAGTLVMADGTGHVFCDVRDETRALAIDLQHDEFKRIIVEVSDHTPEEARDLILAAVGPGVGSAAPESDRKGDEPRRIPAGTSR
ncbi:MAG: hypothetical protein Q8S73_04540 [Deltaproteobacteria bacterium]|nr:hypothetical protein [Myxococcales bacterium]MDP3213348.1 hypothetical protein [Deltaproteobacteria bacterium]